VSTVIWTLADAKCGEDVSTSDVGRRPTFYPHLILTPDSPTLSIGRQGKQLKAVSFYSLGPSRGNAATVNDAGHGMNAVRTLLGPKEDVWKRMRPTWPSHFGGRPQGNSDRLISEKGPQCPLLTFYRKSPALERQT